MRRRAGRGIDADWLVEIGIRDVVSLPAAEALLREIVAASIFNMNVNRRRANMIFKICNRFRMIFNKFPSIIY